ncbi:MAG: DUF4339 domain-containing protein [Myxococcales bacterium]|nr:DUF4339 domain-containing protein [Myxococcales bacterium]
MWYALIDDTQVGPLGLSAFVELHSKGQLQPGTLVWKDGMGDWLPFETMPELARAISLSGAFRGDDDDEAGGSEEAATIMMAADGDASWSSFLNELTEKTPLGAAVEVPVTRPPARPAPSPPAPVREESPVGAPRPSAERRVVLTPPPPPPPEPAMTGPRKGMEIDFGALVSEDEVEEEEEPPALPDPPDVAPPGRRTPLWLWMLLLPLLGAGGAGIVILVQQAKAPEPPVVRAQPLEPVTVSLSSPPVVTTLAAPVAATLAAPVAATLAAPVAATLAAPVAATLAAPVAATLAAPVAATLAAPVSVAPTVPASGSSPSVASAPPKTPATTPPTAPPKADPAPTRSTPPGPRPPPPVATGSPGAPAGATKTLSRAELLSVLSANQAAIKSCAADQPDSKGLVTVATAIERDGSVSSAQVTSGRLRGTPVAACIEDKVMGLRFPKFSGDPMRVNLPLTL